MYHIEFWNPYHPGCYHTRLCSIPSFQETVKSLGLKLKEMELKELIKGSGTRQDENVNFREFQMKMEDSVWMKTEQGTSGEAEGFGKEFLVTNKYCDKEQK